MVSPCYPGRSKGLAFPKFKGFMGQEFQDLKGFMSDMFQGHQRSKGFRVSRDIVFPHVIQAFKEFDIFKIQRFQGLRDAEFQGPKV